MPYRNGYSVLPGLLKLEEPIFRRDDDYDYFIAEKRRETARRQCYLSHDISADVLTAISAFVASQANWVSVERFDDIAMQLQEDIAIHRVEKDRDWLAACHICFPSHWRPEEKIGGSLRELHGPVPGINLDASHSLAQTMVNHGPFVRYVWSPVFDARRINYHPDLPHPAFDPRDPRVFVKVERQTIVGFPELNAALFVMRQNIIPQSQIDYPALHQSLLGMTPAEKQYKGVTPELLEYLSLKT